MKNINMHPLQSREWALFREKTGVKSVILDNLIVYIHSVPNMNYKIGYVPKSSDINQKMLDSLLEIGKKENCIFIQLEPNIEAEISKNYEFKNLYPSSHPLFTKYTFVLDLTKPEEELLKNMHPKTRYNIRIAEKKGVKVTEDNSDNAFEKYIKLNKETTKRQHFYAHSEAYQRLMWKTLRMANGKWQMANKDRLAAHLLKATYENETLVCWVLFVLGDTLYYPYGASSDKHREVMASNLMMWETIKFGKKLGLKKFDMWGSLGPNPNHNDPWYGFHRFKEGYGPKLVELTGSYDFVINKKLYFAYKILNNIRWLLLRLK